LLDFSDKTIEITKFSLWKDHQQIVGVSLPPECIFSVGEQHYQENKFVANNSESVRNIWEM
jgi:hypothetical protein